MSYRCVVCQSEQSVLRYALRDVSFGHEGTWDYVNCVSCGHGSIFPMPSGESLKALYEALYAAEKGAEMIKIGQSHFDVRLQKRRAAMLRATIEREPKRILDAGCGMGFSLKKLSEQFPTAHCLGVELSAHAAEYARGLGGLDIQQRDFHQIEDSGFDIITFNHVIEHLSDPNDTLAHAHQLLDQNGRLLIEVPTSTGWALKLWGSYWWCHLPPQHLHLFSPEGLQRLMRNHGFKCCGQEMAAYPMSFSMGWIVYVRAKWGSFSSYRQNVLVRTLSFVVGLIILPVCVILDILLAPLLGWWKGDIVTLIFKKTAS